VGLLLSKRLIGLEGKMQPRVKYGTSTGTRSPMGERQEGEPRVGLHTAMHTT